MDQDAQDMMGRLTNKLFAKDQATDVARAGKSSEEVIGHRFVFVSGHPRSGTNWVSSLINLHPDAFCDGEFHFLILRWAMDGYTSLPWYLGAQEPYRSIAERNFHQLIRESLVQRAQDRLGRNAPTVVGDHTPRLFRMMIPPPEGRYIVVQRDGRDVLVSYTFHLLNTKAPEVIPESIRGFYQQQISTLDGTMHAQRKAGLALLTHEPWTRYYSAFWSEHVRHDVRISRWTADDERTAAWIKGVKFVRYEDLRADVEQGRRGMYEHLGLDPALARPVSSESNTAPGFGGREDVTSFYRKGESGDWKNHFSRDMASWFNDSAGAALIELGYEPDVSWVGRVNPTVGDVRESAIDPPVRTTVRTPAALVPGS